MTVRWVALDETRTRLTTAELADKLDLPFDGACRLVASLERAGLAFPADRRRENVKGRPTIVWDLPVALGVRLG